MIDITMMARRELGALPSAPPQKRASLRPSLLIAVIIKIAIIVNLNRRYNQLIKKSGV
jgi:hypothetical protein